MVNNFYKYVKSFNDSKLGQAVSRRKTTIVGQCDNLRTVKYQLIYQSNTIKVTMKSKDNFGILQCKFFFFNSCPHNT